MSWIFWSTARFWSPLSAAEETAPVIPRVTAQAAATTTVSARRRAMAGRPFVGCLVGVPAKYRSEAENFVGCLYTKIPPEGESRGEHGQSHDATDDPRRDRDHVGDADERG